jgi:hypothetical protein
MRIAIVAAGFTPAEADGLRRSMAAFRRRGQLERWHDKLVSGMVARGYDRDFAERCFKQIEGFGYYGFPESHAASFALLVYVSAWLKCHYPDVFLAAILNAQPMGFYAPAPARPRRDRARGRGAPGRRQLLSYGIRPRRSAPARETPLARRPARPARGQGPGRGRGGPDRHRALAPLSHDRRAAAPRPGDARDPRCSSPRRTPSARWG